jgi:molybdenum ABC transporter molybdate-binding protein
MLNRQMKKCLLGISGMLLAAVSSLAWSQSAPTVCINVGNGTPAATFAVASNFYEPAQALAASFEQTGPGLGKTIRICQNSTGLLVAEINAGTSPYSLFLAANTAGPTSITISKGTPFTYAHGIPVLWSHTLTATQMMSGSMINKTNVTSLAIGNPTLAPYGAAAQAILTSIGQWEPQPSSWITEYDNIDLTYQAALAGTQVAGFVSKAQVCDQLSQAGFQQFDASFDIVQNGVVLNQGNVTTATAFQTYLLTPTVQTRLVNDFCYASPTLGLRKSNREK